jgi:hypothetical protein
MTTPDPTTLSVLAATITGMTTAIGVLWRQVTGHLGKIETKLDTTEKRLVDCESDRLAIWRRLAEQAGKEVEELKGNVE